MAMFGLGKLPETLWRLCFWARGILECMLILAGHNRGVQNIVSKGGWAQD